MELSPNFTFLEQRFPDVAEIATLAERSVYRDSRGACFHARHALERLVIRIFKFDKTLTTPDSQNLYNYMHDSAFRELLPEPVWLKADLIRDQGNTAVHGKKTPKPETALRLVQELAHVFYWAGRTYFKGGAEKLATYSYDESVIPTETTGGRPSSVAELEQLKKKLDESDAEKLRLEENLKAVQEELAAIRAENEAVPETHDWNEAETRRLIIDLELLRAGWTLDAPRDREYEVTGMPSAKGIGYADYVLWGDDGRPLAVIEAKKTTVDPAVGKRQAELYADCLEQMHGQRPVIYYTSGYETWLWDDAFYPPRRVAGFANRDELQLMIHRRTTREDLDDARVNPTICERYYQQQAIRSVLERFGQERSRKALVVMATGSGKTRLSIAAVEILMKKNWVRRVLFLADRTALVRQAKNAFNKFLPQVPIVNLVEEKEDTAARIVFSTYPTMLNAIDQVGASGQQRFGPGHFDLIIIDEAHRSVYQKYGAIFEFFDALLLGLTATPKTEVDKNTYRLFELDNHMPTYAYELDQAVNDEFLVPPKAISMPLKFIREGVKYAELSPEEREEYEEKFYDEEEGLPEAISPAAVNKWLFNIDTVDQVLAHLMQFGQKVDGGDTLGKTIIFAKNHDHAEFIQQRFDICYPAMAGKFLRVIDNQVKYAQSLIDDFSVADKSPTIAVSVDMLDTGIDVPEIVNLVFFKLVYSKTKFWQMVGRGTRLCPDLFGPRQDKAFFFIFDFCQNLEFFGDKPEGHEAAVQESVKQRIFKRRLAIVRHLQQQATDGEESTPLTALAVTLCDQMHQIVSGLDKNNFIVRARSRYVDRYADRSRWNRLTDEAEAEVISELSHLPHVDDDTEVARRFDLLLLNLQLALLKGDAGFDRYQQSVRELAAGLEEKANIAPVKAQLALIAELQSDTFWEDVTLPILERVRLKLRNLIQFLDRQGPREQVYTDFDDHLGTGQEKVIVTRDESLKNYRLKMASYLREHTDHATIERIRQNQPIRAGDIESLEAMLFADSGIGTRKDYDEAYGTDQPLGVLVRQVLGLDQKAAKEVFADFLQLATLNSQQIEFVNRIVDHLVENGVMDLEVLFDRPFTEWSESGVAGVFPDDEVEVVKQRIEQINANAVVAVE